LTIETCTDTSTLGLVRDGVVLAEAAFPSRYTLAKRLLPRLTWLLDEAGSTREELDALAVSLGPGAFTGVRIGIAAAKTLAHGLRIPLVGVPTLEALAYPFRACHDALLVPMVNARRQQAYLALYRSEGGTLRRLTADLVLSAGPCVEELGRHVDALREIVFVGQLDGLPSGFMEGLPLPACTVRSLITPHALAALGAARLAQGDVDDPMTLAPIYLRSAAD
jgi:tRNA threonylcarbamoyladenosine biosynthesis protein TsaB